MTALHAGLADGRWQAFSLVEQLANVGSEVERAISWSAKGRPKHCSKAIDRGLELLDLTIADPRHRERLKELTRLREVASRLFPRSQRVRLDRMALGIDTSMPLAWRRPSNGSGALAS